MNIRAAAVRVISQVIEYGRSLSDCLPDETKSFSDPRDRALLQAICFGVCRWYFRLEEIAQQLMEKPLKQKDIDVHFLIVIGLYQLIYMRIPAYAAVSETVNANKKKWARGLINGVLRQFQRNADEFEETDPFSHPTWMMEEIEKNYPQKWEAILDANNQHPPFALRVNQQRMSREKYLEKLAQAGIVAKEIPETQLTCNKFRDLLQAKLLCKMVLHNSPQNCYQFLRANACWMLVRHPAAKPRIF
jgi:16S rRNA (cytosine967-C5)-methyltransferase